MENSRNREKDKQSSERIKRKVRLDEEGNVITQFEDSPAEGKPRSATVFDERSPLTRKNKFLESESLGDPSSSRKSSRKKKSEKIPRIENFSNLMEKDLNDWDTKDVGFWLRNLTGVSRDYSMMFEKEHINGRSLILLKEIHLQMFMNVDNLNDLLVITDAIDLLKRNPPGFVNNNNNNTDNNNAKLENATNGKKISPSRLGKGENSTSSLSLREEVAKLREKYDWDDLTQAEATILENRFIIKSNESASSGDAPQDENASDPGIHNINREDLNEDEEVLRIRDRALTEDDIRKKKNSSSPSKVFQNLQHQHVIFNSGFFELNQLNKNSHSNSSNSISNVKEPSNKNNVNITPIIVQVPPVQSLPSSPIQTKETKKKKKLKKLFTLLKPSKNSFDLGGNEEQKMINPLHGADLTSFKTRTYSMDKMSLSELYLPQNLSTALTDPRVELFEEEESSQNVLKEMDQDGNLTIKGASIEKIVSYITSPEIVDPDFLFAFLLTFQRFTTSKNLLELLILRYNMPPVSDNIEVTRQFLIPIRLRIFNTLKEWVNRYFSDFSNEPELLNTLKEFIDGTMDKTGMKNASKQLKELIAKCESGVNTRQIIQHQFNSNPKKPLVPSNKNPKQLRCLDIHPKEIARQLSLFEHELFRLIKPRECIKQNWQKPGKNQNASNVLAMIKHFNAMSNWISTEILNVEDLTLRAVTLNRFILIAEKAFVLNNFNTVMEVISSLQSAHIGRLKQTWALLPPKSLEMWKKLLKFMDAEGNFAEYRAYLKTIDPPCLPYLGVYLTDLTFIEVKFFKILYILKLTPLFLKKEGNTDLIGDSKLPNVAKIKIISNVVREIQLFQQTPYCLEKVPIIHDFILQFSDVIDEEELYKQSVRLEARVKKRGPNSGDNKT